MRAPRAAGSALGPRRTGVCRMESPSPTLSEEFGPIHSMIRVDRGYRIVDADTPEGIADGHIGEILWDLIPGTAEVWLAAYERAWSTGRTAECVFWRGHVRKAILTRSEDGLYVTSETWVIASLDVTNLRTLRASMDNVIATLAAEGRQVASSDPRTSP
jgi:hypothetical protein